MNTSTPGPEESDLHRLVPPDSKRRKARARFFYMSGLAITFGIVVGVAWLAYQKLIPLPLLTEPQKAALHEAEVSQLDEVTADASPTEAAATETSLVQVAAVGGQSTGTSAVGALPANPRMLAQANVSPRSPTPTSTPFPYVDTMEGVVGRGGANLWDAANGRLIQPLEQGALVTVLARSDDGIWLQVETERGDRGWTESAALIVFDVDRLRPQAVVLMPITPTPTVMAAEMIAPTVVESRPEHDEMDGPAEKVTSAERAPVKGDEPASKLRPTPMVEDGEPTVQVNLTEGRLNIRAGPAASYRIITKAFPNEVFLVTGRSGTGEWLQIVVADVKGGFGWVSADYVRSSEPISTLPVATEISNAPTYVEPSNRVVPSGTGDGTGHAPNALPIPMETASGKPYKVAYAPMGKVAADSVTGLHGKLVIQKEWGGDIYVYDLETGELRLLTGGFDPALSPDGTQVVFTRNGSENGIYIIHVDGSNERLIFSGRELLRSPKWSPDGQYIVFERGDQFIFCRGERSRCRRATLGMDAEVPETERQPQLARVDVNGGSYQDIPALLYARAPDWNEGGITYMSGAGIQATLDEPSATTREVFFQPLKEYEMDPDWQPNNGRIVFQRRELSHWEIFSVNPDGSDFKALTEPTFTLVDEIPSNVSPAWSYDGQHIVFLSNHTPSQSAGEWHVWVMDADGSHRRRLPIDLHFTYTFVAEQMLDWGP